MLTCIRFGTAAVGLMALLIGETAHGAVEAQLGDGTKFFSVQHQTATIVEAEFAAWRGESWKWVEMTTERRPGEAEHRSIIEGMSSEFGTRLEGHVELGGLDTATWNLRVTEDAEKATDVFAAVVFKFSAEHLAQTSALAPEISDDKTGWSFALGPELPPIVVSFDKPLDSIMFEPGTDNEIRAYVMSRNAHQEMAEFRMTLTIPGTFQQTPAQRLAERDETWWANDFLWNRSPVDLSFLNADEKPAGKRGFLRAVGEDLVFEDGTKARFWGTNLSAYALFAPRTPEAARAQAKRISALGFNLVRIHHHDSIWVYPNIFGRNAEGTRELYPEALERLDWLIKCLRDEGIYIWLDLHVGRELSASDGVEAFEEIAKGSPPRAGMQGYLFVNDSLQARAREFAEAYLSHVNQYTGLALKDDPAIVAVLLTNENDLSHHFGNALLPDKNIPWHTKRYMASAREFATAHGLDEDRVWRSWEFGPSKIFLADLEHAYFDAATRELRELGVKVPIVGTNNWGAMSVAGLISLAEGDIVDTHAYGTANDVERDPRFDATLASWLAGGAVAGKPHTVSEWNAEPPSDFDRHQLPAHLAAIASLQGWSAMMQYAYSQSPMSMAHAGEWESYTDPVLMSLMPAAALLYRSGHVREARFSYELNLPEDVFTGREISARSSRAIRTLTETSKLRIIVPKIEALDWSNPSPPSSDRKQVTDPDFDAIGEGATRACSDTGEICRDWRKGIYTVETERSQIAGGWVGGHEIVLANTKVNLETTNATVAVQSLDDRPIESATRIMISMSAQAVLQAKGKLPYFSEPLRGEIRIRAPAGLNAYRADGSGKLRPIPFERTSDAYVIKLGPDIGANWLFLE